MLWKCLETNVGLVQGNSSVLHWALLGYCIYLIEQYAEPKLAPYLGGGVI